MPSNSQEALFSLVQDNSPTAAGDFQCQPLSRAAAEATERLILTSTNPFMLPRMVRESWMHCPVWHPTRLYVFIFSDLVFLLGKKKKKKHQQNFPPESFPLTQALPVTSVQHHGAASRHTSDGPPQQSQDTHQSCMESNKGTCKPQLVLPLTIWRVTACFGIKGFLCALTEANEQP